MTGDADGAVKALVDGKLAYNPDVQCSHHGEGHHGGRCGEDKYGCHGNGGCH